MLEYLSVGATAVQVGTANFVNPLAPERLVGPSKTGSRQVKLFTSMI